MVIIELSMIINNITDYIPPKYERINKNSIILKYITFIIIGIVFTIFFGTMQLIHQQFNTTLAIINFIFIILLFILDVFWLYYKLQHIIIGTYKIFMDLSILRSNSKYYSGLEIPDSFISESFPEITIQLPVYKESLENTIKPTLMSAIEQANRYKSETGSLCNIVVCDDGYNLISQEEREARKEFYKIHNIGFSARPHPSKYKRNGRFKKAGNLNFSMNYAPIFENMFQTTENNGSALLNISLQEVIELGAIFEGILFYGDYIFLIDSDTRFPNFSIQENGCLKRVIKDYMFDGKDTVLYIQCFTGPYLSTKYLSEKSVFHFTCHIYNGILVATAMTSMAPLVGHNACLNHKIIHKISHKGDNDFRYYWDENRISEDFDCMMRGCDQGYIGRYMSCAGIFLEGISFNYMTEYFKVSKFACGAAELTFNPVSKWFVKGGGFFSSDIIGFVTCKEIEWYNKLSIVSYILNFIAIAQAHLSMFYNLIFFEQLFNILPYRLLPVNLMIEGIVAWGVINTFNNVIFSMRLKFDSLAVLRQQIRELFFTSSLYGSLSVRFSIMYFSHLFNLDIQFGATQKETEQVTLLDWVNSTKYECIIYTFYLICIGIRLFIFPIRTKLHTFYFGCLPLLTNIIWFWFGPIVFDILPKNMDKRNTYSYDTNQQTFIDKYKNQIPNSPLFTNN